MVMVDGCFIYMLHSVTPTASVTGELYEHGQVNDKDLL